jgi:hypothetical protein
VRESEVSGKDDFCAHAFRMTVGGKRARP